MRVGSALTDRVGGGTAAPARGAEGPCTCVEGWREGVPPPPGWREGGPFT